MNAAPDGSVIQREAPRADLLAFEIKDRITKPDIEWMSSIADEAMKIHDKIDMLLIMSNYEGSDLGARFDGYASTVMARSVAHIRNYVVVGAPLFARAMITLSGTVMPVETKTFDLADEAAAWAYLAEAGPATARS
ncbi:STAS/SEC14 domain-containing protein [Methylobacterium sp. J-001]|uniref:STAS/SEC14 domain-containing protein n=1 Tax=Methylobacterium sp. J-001 TaxID=2836609 RepID=UPI001FB89842|nr:STAS/SEC14 domain-containing protein [Methylobacterium sp. J-001]MCJ2117266.1 STAS/SEC14 domain-containing protein [Methylobacterium sp. J-001]